MVRQAGVVFFVVGNGTQDESWVTRFVGIDIPVLNPSGRTVRGLALIVLEFDFPFPKELGGYQSFASTGEVALVCRDVDQECAVPSRDHQHRGVSKTKAVLALEDGVGGGRPADGEPIAGYQAVLGHG